ncbi:hypothetical protein OSB04_un000918 [Centaurea solstitialis]|uniref:Uncharacterized protein n=1 Tax=Centaurea solstitialis TaxID=347529 RepID=A0AA38SGY7_9ASTR|nr:hypothetical protein OSB04_un000984 [Centaurea solstitialis]KAJ9535919.1 hypothetical protein OSB04_un000918 [Centaurea solstitialis]
MDANGVNPWGKPQKKAGNRSNSGKFSKKMSKKFEKTKSVASSASKKIKAGASAGIIWLKLKYKLAKKK